MMESLFSQQFQQHFKVCYGDLYCFHNIISSLWMYIDELT